jgi:hypothetical protein
MESPETDLSGPFAVLLQDTTHRLDRIEDELEDISDHYTCSVEDRSYSGFVEALRLSAHGLRQLVLKRRDEFHELAEPEGKQGAYSNLAADAETIGVQLEEHLPELGTDRPQELEVFAVPFTRMAKKIVKNAELLFFPWTFDGYEAQVYDTGSLEAADPDLIDNLESVFGADIKFIKLWHPATRECDIFHHAVFAHELGHVAIKQKVPEEHLKAAEVPSGPGRERPTFETVGHNDLPKPPDLDGEQNKRLLRWFRELACDVFAMRLIGPVFAIAFAEVTSPYRTLEPTDGAGTADHPPAHIRFGFLREEIERFFPTDSAARTRLTTYTDVYLKALSSGPEAIPGSADWLKEAIERFRSYVGALLGDAEYKVSTLSEDLGIVHDLAERGIPPAERVLASYPLGKAEGDAEEWSRPIDWRSVINGVLIWHLGKVGFPIVPETAAPTTKEDENGFEMQRQLAIDLAVGGVELAEFHTHSAYLREHYKHMRLGKEELEERVQR